MQMLYFFHEQIGMEPHSFENNYYLVLFEIIRIVPKEMDHYLKLILQDGEDYVSFLSQFLARES
jgi:hypothetical protein